MSTKWMNEAICSQTDPDTWVSDYYHPAQIAVLKGICSKCPVIAECREYAITNHLNYGVWGGLTATERSRIARTARKAARA